VGGIALDFHFRFGGIGATELFPQTQSFIIMFDTVP